MFERFTREAREIVTTAVDEAELRGDSRVGTEHLLVAAAAAPGLAGILPTKEELREELDVEVDSVGRELLTINDPDSPFLIAFVEVRISGTPVCREHSELKWCETFELLSLNLAPSDRRFVQTVLV